MAPTKTEQQAVRALARLLAGVRVNDETVGLVGQLTGAIYGLQAAIDLDYASRAVVGEARALSYRKELVSARVSLSRNERPGKKWLGGFYFHSALARIASAADRMTKKLRGGRNFGERTARRRLLFADASEVETVYQAVNDLKHDFEGRTSKNDVSVAEALKALGAEVRLARQEWPKR